MSVHASSSPYVVPDATVGGAQLAHGGQTTQGQNPWLSYFGPPQGPLVTDAYDKYAEQNYDLPEAYKGKNLYLRDTINGLITDGSQPDFYTTILLPWAQTDQITFAWNEFQFNETLAGRVPHEGISRLVTSSKRAKSDKSVRRGIAMVLEHGFMSTAEGVEHYRRNLLGIAQCVQETANHDVMAALFSSDNYDRQWERDHGILSDGIRRIVSEEVYQYAAIQKQENGLDIAIEQAKQRMGRYGAKPDTLVIPPKVSIYLTMVRPEKTQYYIAGPAGAKNLRQGPDALTSFRGLKVFETRGFDVYQGEAPIDIGLRRRQVGEYYPVIDYSTAKTVKDSGWAPQNASTIVYDESIDNWRRVTIHEMLHNCGRYNAQGDFVWNGRSQGSIERQFNDVHFNQSRKDGYAAVAKHVENKFFYGTTSDSGSSPEAVFTASQFVPKSITPDEYNTYPPDLFYSNWDVGEVEDEDDAVVGGTYRAVRTISGFSHVHVIADGWHNKFAAAVVRLNENSGLTAAAAEEMDLFSQGALEASANTARSPLAGLNGMSVIAIGEQLFHAQNQTEEFNRLFCNATVGNAAETLEDALAVTSVDTNGYTGHPALHMSYKGLKVIAASGTPKQVALAQELENRIEKVVQIAQAGLSGFARIARNFLPENYMHTSDGSKRVAISDDHAVRSVVFQMLLNAPCGHTLVPIARDGTVNSAFANVSGDTIVCPAFAVKHFHAARAGIVGGLALNNVGLQVTQGRNTAQREVLASHWCPNINGGYDLQAYTQTNRVAAQARKRGTITSNRGTKRSQQFVSGTAKRGSGSSYEPTQRAAPTGNPVANLYAQQSNNAIGTHEEERQAAQKAFEATGTKKNYMTDESTRAGNYNIAQGAFYTKTMHENYTKVLAAPAMKLARNAAQATAVALILLSTDTMKRKNVELFVDTGLPLPFTFLLTRPFIEHQMQSLVCMKAGPETGNTYYGHNSVTVGDDAVSKMHYVNLTFYSKAIVKESKNVFLLEDVYANGYVGGNDTKFFKSDREVQGYDAANPTAPSMLALMIGTKESTTLPNPLSITGEFGGVLDKDGHNKKRFADRNGMHYSTAAYYSAHFGLANVAQADPARYTEMPRFQKDTRTMNTMCFQGTQFLFNSDSQKFDIHVTNTGHWGHTYPGVKAVREGHTKYMENTGGPKFPVDMGKAVAPTYNN